MVSADSRDGIKIHTEHNNDAAISYLLIKKADFTDSGKYTCAPSNAELVSIRVNVLNGKFVFFFNTFALKFCKYIGTTE